MSELILWTYDWVPEGPRGFVRDIRLRWACEEAGLDYSVRTVPFSDRGADHLARQPFGQAPFLTDGELEIFESGAGLLHLVQTFQAPRRLRFFAAGLFNQVLVSDQNLVNVVLGSHWPGQATN